MMLRAVSTALLLSLLTASAAEAPKQRILFARLAPASAGMFLADADGQNERPLMPATSLDYNGSFSADGRWIVFTSERAGSANLYRVHPDGSGLERLTDSPSFDDQGALSPDGRNVAFVSTRDGGTANIWLLDLATHRVTNLTKNKSGNFRPRWSPDGKWIAFTSDHDEPKRRHLPQWEQVHYTALYVVHPDGNSLKRLTRLGAYAANAKWAPDGSHVIYSDAADDWTTARRTVSIDIATGQETETQADKKFPGAHGSLSPDGKRIVYDKEIVPVIRGVAPIFSRDQRYDLFGTGYFFAALSPDGRRVLTTGQPQRFLRAMNIDGTDVKTIFDSGDALKKLVSPSWSPDGGHIAFAMGGFFERPVTSAQLAIIRADGTDLQILTQGEVSSGFPSFSPDGKNLVYRVLGNGEQGLRILSLADRKVTTLTTAWDNFPAWSPRGDRIAFTRLLDGDFEIYTIRPDGSDLRKLTSDHGNDAHSSWSPDGKWLLYASSRMGWKDEGGGQSYGEIFVMREDGQDARQLTDNQWEDATGAWLPPAN